MVIEWDGSFSNYLYYYHMRNGNIVKIENENHGEEENKYGKYEAFVEFDIHLDEV